MKVTVEDLSTVKKKIIVEFPAEYVNKEMDTAYNELRAGISINGFRKGKVPKTVLESRYKDHVLGDAATKLIENSYPKIIRDKNLSPVARPEITIHDKVEQGKSFSYTAIVEVKPNIKVENYIGMELTGEAIRVDDSEIEKSIDILRERNATFSDVERPSAEKDLAVIDFEGFLDGKPANNTKASDYPVVIGSNSLIPEFEKALTGLKKGDEKEINVKFPDDYHSKDLASKELLFKIKVKDIKERILPVLDDEFAKDLQLDNLEQLRDKIKENILYEKEAAKKKKFNQEILKNLIEKNKFDIPPVLVDSYLQSFVAQAMENIKKGKVRPEEALGATPEKLKERYAGAAETRVREEVILETIAQQENISVSEDEVDLKIRELAQVRNQNYHELRKQLREQGTDGILAAGMMEEKVLDFIIAKANITTHDVITVK